MTPTGTNWTNGFGMTPNLLPRMFLLPSLKRPLKMMISKATPLNVRRPQTMPRRGLPVDVGGDVGAAVAAETDGDLTNQQAHDPTPLPAMTPARPMLMMTSAKSSLRKIMRTL